MRQPCRVKMNSERVLSRRARPRVNEYLRTDALVHKRRVAKIKQRNVRQPRATAVAGGQRNAAQHAVDAQPDGLRVAVLGRDKHRRLVANLRTRRKPCSTTCMSATCNAQQPAQQRRAMQGSLHVSMTQRNNLCSKGEPCKATCTSA